MKSARFAASAVLALAFASACGGETSAPATPAAPQAAAPAPAPGPDYAGFVSAPGRIEGDLARDAVRKPAEVLAFSKIMPGQTVFEMEAGSGYYTELFSRAVGPTGKVIMQSPREFERFYKEQLDARLKDNRLANVTVSWTKFDTLESGDATIDVVTWFQGPHELWCTSSCSNIPMGDPAKAFADIARVLKPGGYFVVMDHVAMAGVPNATSGNIHRIDPAQVRPLIEAAGLVFEEESQILRNPADDLGKDVFDPAVQGKTDQFLMRFRKP